MSDTSEKGTFVGGFVTAILVVIFIYLLYSNTYGDKGYYGDGDTRSTIDILRIKMAEKCIDELSDFTVKLIETENDDNVTFSKDFLESCNDYQNEAYL